MSKTYNIAVIAGDGSGPALLREARKIINLVAERYNFQINFSEHPYGGEHYLRTNGELLPESALAEFRRADAVLLGTLGHPDVRPELLIKGILMHIRMAMDQYIYLRPVKLYPGVPTPLRKKGPEDIDFLIVRESTGGLYSGIGGSTLKYTSNEVAMETMLYSRMQVERCVRFAFEQAVKRDRGKGIVLCGKTSVLTHVYDLWDRVFNEIGEKEFPRIPRRYHNIDELCMLLIKTPEVFDVIVTGNLFGDILADMGAIIQGGIGVAAGGNINPDGISMFSPIGGDFSTDVWEKTLKNPFSAIQATALMFENLGETEASNCIESALMNVTGRLIPGTDPHAMGFETSEIGDMVAEQL